jgi:citrate synthase
MSHKIKVITDIVLKAAETARRETSSDPEPDLTSQVQWPVHCTVGPGLEGAIACESKVGYVNGSKGWLIYRGYDIFDLCAYSTFEEVCFLLLNGHLPTDAELNVYKNKLAKYRYVNDTLRLLMGFPVENMNAMGALRMGTNLMRQEFTSLDREGVGVPGATIIGSDEDSIAMETVPEGEKRAHFEFRHAAGSWRRECRLDLQDASGMDACNHLIAGVATITAAIARIHQGRMPIEPDPGLSHAANFLYMIKGRRPTPVEERIMDIALILHADHGMNASTFASMVVASTLSDVYFSVGAGIAALNGPLHGGANVEVIKDLESIGSVKNVRPWVERIMASKGRFMGFGHRVYKAYDPRARILGPLAKFVVEGRPSVAHLYAVARELEREVVTRLGAEKKIFPNVDFYSGIVYRGLGIDPEMFTPVFAVSRVAGWTARVNEYLARNRIFRPRAVYTGELYKKYKRAGRRR